MKIVKIFLLAFVIGASTNASAQTTNFKVYSLFVLNIAKYTSWPSMPSELQITVLGKSKVYDELLKHSSINGIPLKIRQAEDAKEIGDVQIVYLSDGKSGSLEDLVKITQGRSVMIITEREGLVKKGAAFSFLVTENNNLRFDLNSTELEKRNIKVAKNLSGLANSVL